MKHEIIYTEYYALIVSDEEISYENYAIHLADKWILEVGAIHQSNGHKTIMDKEYGYNRTRREILAKYCKKIIAHRPLTDAPIVEEVPLLPKFIKEDDVEDLALAYSSSKGNVNPEGYSDKQVGLLHGFIDGYNKAKETYKYTEEDLKNAFYNGWLYRGEKEYEYPKALNEFTQCLQQQKRPKYFETVCDCQECGANKTNLSLDMGCENKIATITNPQGQTEIVGEYIYE